MPNSPLNIAKAALAISWRTVRAMFLAYAVLFSVASTVAAFVIVRKVTRPVSEVKRLRDHNPETTIYMDMVLEGLPRGDTLLHRPVPLDSISPNLVKAVLAAEDDGFYTHPGVDLGAMLEAMEYNRRHNRIRRGASTITQQMAKNLFAGSERTFDRKYRELLYTVLMERYLGKDRILELYLNYAQWGKNVFGCEAASQVYYNRACGDLSLMQASRLAAVLAKPESLTPHHAQSILLQKRIAVIAQNLHLHRQIGDSGYTALSGLELPSPDTAVADDAEDQPGPFMEME